MDKILPLEENPHKAGMLGFHFDNPLFATGVCQIMGSNTDQWSKELRSAYNSTYGSGINPEAVKYLLEALEDLVEAVPKQTADADWWDDSLVRAVDKANAAIDKAKL